MSNKCSSTIHDHAKAIYPELADNLVAVSNYNELPRAYTVDVIEKCGFETRKCDGKICKACCEFVKKNSKSCEPGSSKKRKLSECTDQPKGRNISS